MLNPDLLRLNQWALVPQLCQLSGTLYPRGSRLRFSAAEVLATVESVDSYICKSSFISWLTTPQNESAITYPCIDPCLLLCSCAAGPFRHYPDEDAL